jgi:hypothetical protein
MTTVTIASWLIEQEARALLTRLERVKPFALHETMVPAAGLAPAAQSAIERFLLGGRRTLGQRVRGFLRWLRGPGRLAPPTEQQRRFTVIRLQFNDVLSQFDLFTEVITQRSEHETGVWLSGLDVAAWDALNLPGGYFEPPPVICYLARGPGAAIRRARTRLPGGASNPVAIIRVPRERMVGHGIASSLIHEVGHQGAALLCLVESLRPALQLHQARLGPAERASWACYERWVSEIVADLWSVAKLGIGSTLGLLGVVSLPRWFVLRPSGDDPHPIPWIRVLLSCAMGDGLYPHPQWTSLARVWRSLYPPEAVTSEHRRTLAELEATLPGFVAMLLDHRPATLHGRSLREVLSHSDRRPEQLLARYHRWRDRPGAIATATPSSARPGRRAGSAPNSRATSSASCSPSGRCAARSTSRPSVPTDPWRSRSGERPDLPEEHVMANEQTIPETCSVHRRPVAAGTVIVFTIKPPPKAEEFDLDDVEWHIAGPFTGMERTVTGGPTYDWDTQGERAGTYSVFAVLTRKGGVITRQGDQGAGGGGGGGSLSMLVPGSSSEATPTPPSTNRGRQPTRPWHIQLTPSSSVNQEGVVPVSLQRTALVETVDQVLWVIIRNRTNAIAFRPYQEFIDAVMGNEEKVDGKQAAGLPFRGGDAYALLKLATDAFLMQEVGVLDPFAVLRAGLVNGRRGEGLLDSQVALDSLDEQLNDPTQAEALRVQEERRLGRPLNFAQIKQLRDNYYVALKDEIPAPQVLPYLRIIRERLADVPLKPVEALPRNAYGILRSHLTAPLAVELIWSYWHEEGMLAQTLNAILARFQNRRLTSDGQPDPLARFDIDPLRPLANIFWGWMEDEVHRLTVRRRHFEYEHEYGLKLFGKAIPRLIQPVERRSQFLEAFHNVLLLSHVFFKEDDDTTVIADGFPVLNALRETHLLLAEGAHNQFGDLPSTARAEMLIMEWLLARPELRDFLGGRVMVPYEEAWMDRVDSMKSMQGWTDVSITHFRDMGVFGEQLLLSIRYGNWSVENDPQTAANWARYWRPEIQRYVHAYRSATGVDLTERVDATIPGLLLRQRLGGQFRPELDGAQRPMLPGRREAPLPGVITRGRVQIRQDFE